MDGEPTAASHTDRSEIERLIWRGETFATAASAVVCSTKSIQRFLARSGGLKRRVKERSALRLWLADREELSRGLVAGHSLRRIAMWLGRAPSTISREVSWSGRKDYRAWSADKEALSGAFDPSRRSWRSTRGCAAKSSVAYAQIGPQNRSPRV